MDLFQSHRKILWGLGSLAFFSSLHAQQLGPIFPTHRFPTDESFHLSYDLGIISTSSNFVGALTTTPNTKNGDISIVQQNLTAEFQPNRQLSIGAILSVDSMNLSDSANATASGTSLGDQRVFGEYRFYDEPGVSLGLAAMVKFAAYSNTTSTELGTLNNPRAVYMGDGQTDFSLLLTGEYWITPVLRARVDAGYMLRTEQYSDEIPYLASIAFVTPKVDFELRIRGNASMNNSSFTGDPKQLAAINAAFDNSQYALSGNPWTLVLEPNIEVWVSNSWALRFMYSRAMAGDSSADFTNYSFGASYRWAQTKNKKKRTFQQVDISTDQESGQFQGEKQGEALEPKIVEPSPIKEEPIPKDEEEFR